MQCLFSECISERHLLLRKHNYLGRKLKLNHCKIKETNYLRVMGREERIDQSYSLSSHFPLTRQSLKSNEVKLLKIVHSPTLLFYTINVAANMHFKVERAIWKLLIPQQYYQTNARPKITDQATWFSSAFRTEATGFLRGLPYGNQIIKSPILSNIPELMQLWQ